MRRQGPSTASEQLLLPHPLQNATKQQQQQHLQGASKIFMKKRWILLSISLAIGWTFWLLQKQTITILPPFATTTSTTTTTTQSSQQYTFEFLQVAKAAISAAAVATKAADVSSSNTTPNIIEPFTINATTTTTSRCFSWNSKEWLQGPRLSNARNSMPLSWIHDNFQSSILSHVLSSTDGRNLPDHPNRNETNILDQTLCHPQGRFRSATKFLPPLQQQQQQSYLSILDDWEFRLLYLAIHRLHHQPAMAEYQLRVQHDCFSDSDTSTGLNDNNESHGGKTTTTTTPLQPQLLPPHPYEYECPNAKYLVTALPTLGMGAALRLGAVPAIFMALTTERIPLFIMHAGAEQPFTTTKNRNRNQTQPRLLPDFVTSPWPLASCGGGQNMTFSSSFHHFYHQRQDLQCVFLPTSPCVLTQDMLDQAVLLPETQARTWRRSGILDSKLQSEPVLLVEARTAPAKFDEYRILYTLRQQTFRLVQELIQEWDKESSLSYMNATVKAQWKTHFQRVAKRIQQGAPPPSLPTTQNQSLGGSRHHSYFTYGHRDFRLAHAALLYVLRPNYPSMQRIQQQVQRALQTTPLSTKSSTDKARTLNTNSRHNNATDSNADNIIWIGLPIRGSDKCQAESTCLSFSQYMKLSLQKLREQQNLTAWNGRGKIILTSEDEEVLLQRASYQQAQNHFPLEFVVNEHDVAQGTGLPRRYKDRADDIMISSLAALQLQLLATTSVGNCCSNFYLVLLDLLRNGCGRHDHTYSNKPDVNVPLDSAPTLQCLQETPDPQFHVCCGWTRTDECNAVRKQFGEERERMRNTIAIANETSTL